MKKILMIILILNSYLALGQGQTPLKCLGAEEKIIHTEKIGGVYKKLNQDLISEFIQLSPMIKMDKDVLSHICHKKIKYKSVLLLQYLISNKRVLYSAHPKGEVQLRSIDNLAINEIKKKAAYIFVGLINSLQARAKKPNCVIKTIPELKDFYTGARYILEDTGLLKLLKELKYRNQIFRKLVSKELFENCQA